MDDQLRRLERDWRASGAAVDEVRYLVAALQARVIPPWRAIERVGAVEPSIAHELLSHMGLPDEDLRLMERLTSGRSAVGSANELARALLAHSLEATTRAGAALARRATAERMLASEVPEAHRALDLLLEWIRTEDPAHIDAAYEITTILDSGPCVQGAEEELGPEAWAHFSASQLVMSLARRTARINLILPPETIDDQLAGAFTSAADALAGGASDDARLIAPLILSELGPWLLERVQPRGADP